MMAVRSSGRSEMVGVLLILTALAWALILPGDAAASNSDCFDCHDESILEMSEEERAEMVAPLAPDAAVPKKYVRKFEKISLAIDKDKYEASVHGGFDCIDCHADAGELPHLKHLGAVDCTGCHDDAGSQYNKSIHHRSYLRGDKLATSCQDCHGTHYILPADDAKALTHPKNVATMCARCHSTPEVKREVGVSYPDAVTSYMESIHHKALEEGNLKSATCTSCHRSHDTEGRSDPKSSIYKPNIAATCGKCHPQESEDYLDSVHGLSVAKGVWESPTCTDCHPGHKMLSTKDPKSPNSHFRVSDEICTPCHINEAYCAKYGMTSKVITGYAKSPHGKALNLRDPRAPSCSTCHGSHNVKFHDDPASTVHADNLSTTCSQCHPGIGEELLQGKIHYEYSFVSTFMGEKVLYWVRLAYLILIPLTIGFMVFHNLIDYIKKIRKHFQRKKAEAKYLRLSLSERIQHILLMVSFSTLVISGFALSFNWQIPFMGEGVYQTFRSYVHRIAAVMFIGYFAYHLVWLLGTSRGRGFLWAMIPRFKDATDLVGMITYNLGITATKPKLDRFSYIEKMEYLALVWGTLVMIITGFILWFETSFMKIMPLWGIDVANLVHYMEAVLATLAIIAWHFYSVLINPDVAPMATHWISGYLTEEEMEHEHAYELEKIKAEQEED